MTVGEKTYFEMQLDSTIRETEKLLKKLKEVKLSNNCYNHILIIFKCDCY